MNKLRRIEISKVIDSLKDIVESIEMIAESEQWSFDNLPEGLQCSERGETMEQNAEDLENIRDTIEQATDDLAEIIKR